MEVMIQRHANTRIVSCELQNLGILGPMHSEFGDMNRVEALHAKDRRCVGSQALIEEDAFHATRSVLSHSSSKVAAA